MEAKIGKNDDTNIKVINFYNDYGHCGYNSQF